MAARRLAAAALLLTAANACAWTRLSAPAPFFAGFTIQQESQASPQTPATSPDPQNSSSSQKGQHKEVHHITVAEEVAPPPELTKAEALIQKQQYADAEPLLRKVVGDDPANYVAWFELGFTENALGRVDDSIAAYRKSVAAKPDVFESNLNLGLQLARARQPDAEQFLRAATQLTPTSHVAEGKERAWLSLAHILEDSKPEEALSAYGQAAGLQPKDPEPHLSAGRLDEKQNRFADAEQEYKAALDLDPASPDAATGLANIYLAGNRFPEAEAALKKVIAARPDDMVAHAQLGRVYSAEQKNDAAVAELETAAKLAPTDMAVQRYLADMYTAAGKKDEAVTVYRALVAAHPGDPELHQGLGKALLRAKKYADAQQEFLTSIKLKPDLGTAYGDLAFAASENKDYALTLKALDARVKYLPEIPITYFLRATAYDNLRNVKQAVVNYHLFLDAAGGKFPDQEWQAKHRLIALEPKK